VAINIVFLQGTLSTVPQVRNINGVDRAVFNVSTYETWIDKKKNATVDHREDHVCVIRLDWAGVDVNNLTLGTPVFIEGNLRTRRWFDKKTLSPRQATEISVQKLRMLDGASAQPPAGEMPADAGMPVEEMAVEAAAEAVAGAVAEPQGEDAHETAAEA